MPDGVTRMAGGNLKDGLFNNSHMLLGTEGFGGGHGDMRNAGGMHKKMMHNLNKKAPKAPEGGVSYEDFLKQEAAKKITKAAKNSPALNRKKKMTGGQPAHAGKVAPMIDSGNGRKTRMVVGVRCRPLSGKERTRGSHNCIEVENGVDVYANDPDDKMGGLDYLRLNVTKDKAYTFDHAFGPESRSVDVYERTVKGVVKAVMAGFHGSCFAYGATGSGKTFTMLGSPEEPGVMPRAINDIFTLAKAEDDFNWKFSLTYIEIYNERCKDLLNPSDRDLDVREDPRKGNVVAGAVEVAVNSTQQILELMDRGTLYRTTEATKCNEVSSRSHAVLQINCVGVEKYGDRRKPGKQQIARLSMIDLAGSERAYKTDNSGQRLREGRNINRSLLSLANCINALADKSKKNQHVPYRDSKLTRLLRDSLSGTSVSAMLCAVSPSSDQFEETLNTLKYANRAKAMTPPDRLQKNTKDYNPVAEQVEVLKELKESLIHTMKQMATPKPAVPEKKADKKGDKKASKEERAEKRSKKDDKEEGKRSKKQKEPVSPADSDDEQEAVPNRRLSAQGEAAVGLAKAAQGGHAPMAEVRKVLANLVEAEPEAKSNPSVQAAYVALDNMEAEEVESISAESELLCKEQLSLTKELATAKHAHKIATVRLAWYDAAPNHLSEEKMPGEDRVGGGKETLDELLQRVSVEETNISRLNKEIGENKKAIDALQSEVPERVISSGRLAQLKLTMKHQRASNDYLRLKQQSRSKAGLLTELLTVWQSAIPSDVSDLLREVCDLPAANGKAEKAVAKRHRHSIDTMRRRALETTREADDDAEERPASHRYTADDDDDSDSDDSEGGEADEDEDEGVPGATPWRTLGKLAKQTSQDDDESDGESDDEDGTSKEVVRKATEELKDARTRRLSVMKVVADAAATPKRKKGAKAAPPPPAAESEAGTPSTDATYSTDRASEDSERDAKGRSSAPSSGRSVASKRGVANKDKGLKASSKAAANKAKA